MVLAQTPLRPTCGPYQIIRHLNDDALAAVVYSIGRVSMLPVSVELHSEDL